MSGKLISRDDAIQIFGTDVIRELDSIDCDCTNNVHDSTHEFHAYLKALDKDGIERQVIAVYFQSKDDVEKVEYLDQLDWKIAGYNII